MKEIRERFAVIEDERHQGYIAHNLADVLTLGHELIHEKTNEIPVFQKMLSYLNIAGKTITADALHCQKETCQKIISQKGNYVFGLKSNHRTLFEDVSLFLSGTINMDSVETHTTVEKNAGRIETRVCRKTSDLSWLEGTEEWHGLKSVFSIQRIVEARGTRSDETCYYISSLNETPQRLMEIAREHWKIEALHWLLDVTFSEDYCRFSSENAHRTLNSLSKYALVTHKHFLSASGKKSSIKANMLACLLNHNLFLDLFNFL